MNKCVEKHVFFVRRNLNVFSDFCVLRQMFGGPGPCKNHEKSEKLDSGAHLECVPEFNTIWEAILEQSLAILDRFLDDSEGFLEEFRRNLLASKWILQDLL